MSNERAKWRRWCRMHDRVADQLESGHLDLLVDAGPGREGMRMLNRQSRRESVRAQAMGVIGPKPAMSTTRLLAQRDTLRMDRARRAGEPGRALICHRREQLRVERLLELERAKREKPGPQGIRAMLRDQGT